MFVIRIPPTRAPPPLKMGQVLMNMTQLLVQLARNQAQNMHNNGNNGGNAQVSIKEFSTSTRAPLTHQFSPLMLMIGFMR